MAIDRRPSEKGRTGDRAFAEDPRGTGMKGMNRAALQQIAAYFQALSEPTRLQILNLLRDGERNVGALAEACGYTAANVSRHLSMLVQQGLATREHRGTAVYYRIADPSVYALCDLVCGSIERRYDDVAKVRQSFSIGARGTKAHRKRRRPGD
jgi:DNA-binding transcriptional ArsR family regulator